MSDNPLGDWEIERDRFKDVTAVQRRYLEELSPQAIANALLGEEPIADASRRQRLRNLLDLMYHDVPVGDLRLARNR